MRKGVVMKRMKMLSRVSEAGKKKITLKELIETLCNTESAKDIMSEPDANSERNVTIHQPIEQLLATYCKLYDKKTANKHYPTFLHKFFT